jgi:hypothetical protein
VVASIARRIQIEMRRFNLNACIRKVARAVNPRKKAHTSVQITALGDLGDVVPYPTRQCHDRQ